MNRRQFMVVSGALVVSGCATTTLYQTTVRRGRMAIDIGAYPELAKPGGAILLAAEGMEAPVVLIRRDDRHFKALSSVCTHLGCSVRPSKRFLRCPCHGSTYDLEGQVVRGPAQRALQTFETRVSENRVEIVISG